MRDAHRMKERFDLSLDSRQVVSLLIGGIVVLGAVFVLGVVVGKQLAGNDETREAGDILSALDRQAEKMAAAEPAPPEDLPLTFQDELTKKITTPPPPAPAPAPVRRPEPEKVAAAEPEKLAAPEPDAAPAPEAIPTRAVEKDGGLEKAFAKAASAPARPPAEAVTGGAWTLQLSATQTRDEADRFVTRLRDRGYAPFVVRAEVPGRGTWYRVRMGSFASKDAAQRYLVDFKRETRLDAFVAANN